MFILQVIYNFLNKNFFIKLIKDIFRDPRPNYICTKQFGNPANHSTFFLSIISWYALEYIYLDSKYRIKEIYILLLILFTPIALYARIHLLYQNLNQVNLLVIIDYNRFNIRCNCGYYMVLFLFESSAKWKFSCQKNNEKI